MFKESRSMKGAVENELIAVRKQYEERLETVFMRPAAVVAEKSMVMSLPFSSSMAVRYWIWWGLSWWIWR